MLVRELDSALIRKQLETILSSPEFARSDRMCRFLRFVVERSLSGDEDCLKESVIGVQVFDREIGYDPKTDAIVRVEARRLRSKLLEYSTQFGHQDEVTITLPKGGYIPEIRVREVVSPPPSISIPLTAPSRWTRRSAISAGAALAGSAALGFWISRPRERLNGLIQSRPFTTWPGYETTPAFSPDGLTIAFASGAIYLQPVNSDKAFRLTHSAASEICPRFSPDGHRIAFLRGQENRVLGLHVISIDGTNERKLAETQGTVPLGRVDWSPDGRYLILRDKKAGIDRFVLISVTSGDRQWLSIEGQPDSSDWWPAISPDGTQLAFLRQVVESVNDAWVAPLHIRPDGIAETRTPRRITHDYRDMYGLTWTPDSRSLVVSSRRQSGRLSLWRAPLSGGAMVRLTGSEQDDIMPAVSTAGNRLAYVTRFTDINIWRISADGQVPAKQWISSTLVDTSPQYSPDGTSIAFRSNRSGGDEIWVCGADGANPRRVTDFRTIGAGAPKWSPDSRELAFHARQGDSLDIYLVPANGAGAPRRLTAQPANAWAPSWSADGKAIYYGSKQSGSWEIWKQSVAAGSAERITTRGGYAAIESTDGKYLYYARSNGIRGIFRWPGEELVLPGLHSAMWGNWALGSSGIYYIDYADASPNTGRVQYFDWADQTTRAIAEIPLKPAVSDAGFALSPDGNWILYSQVDRAGSDIMLAESFQ